MATTAWAATALTRKVTVLTRVSNAAGVHGRALFCGRRVLGPAVCGPTSTTTRAGGSSRAMMGTSATVAAAATASSSEFSSGLFASAAPAAAAADAAAAAAASAASAASAAETVEDGGTIPGTAVRVFRTVAALRVWRREQAEAGHAVGLVPTMGALHAGHVALVRAAVQACDAVVVSVFVNPTQFGEHEDLGSYPRTWAADCDVLGALAHTTSTAMAVFAPTTAEMYPSGRPSQAVDGPGSYVTITPAGAVLEGASRPTFFRGVATVCMKLFHIVQPQRAYFGQKDVQQTVVLRRMVRDFHIPLALVVHDTVREPPDGLALSSRNVYLGSRRRAVAGVLRRALLEAEAVFNDSGETSAAAIRAAAHRVLDDALAAQLRLPPAQRARFEVDYLSVADPASMAEVAGAVDPARGAILSGAIRMLPVEDPQPGEDLGHSGGPLVRLIDNIVIKPVGRAKDAADGTA